MPTLNLRNISMETHRALKALAAQHGRSVEAEVRKIVEDAVQPPLRIGSELADFWKKHGTDEDLVVTRSDEPVRKVSFE
ncbi:FitA-like ribbon-helix-helix domain-containing protein [Thauera butanivorans]|uniref:FitA-like ribbon-helix-helix domain-containing protein n=1 Tax=Thauera butanivorans TaxID=86174 RepID=UPI000838902D|nr:Arc family DNA-binding protein [Thauera butanivorans]